MITALIFLSNERFDFLEPGCRRGNYSCDKSIDAERFRFRLQSIHANQKIQILPKVFSSTYSKKLCSKTFQNVNRRIFLRRRSPLKTVFFSCITLMWPGRSKVEVYEKYNWCFALNFLIVRTQIALKFNVLLFIQRRSPSNASFMQEAFWF